MIENYLCQQKVSLLLKFCGSKSWYINQAKCVLILSIILKLLIEVTIAIFL